MKSKLLLYYIKKIAVINLPLSLMATLLTLVISGGITSGKVILNAAEGFCINFSTIGFLFSSYLFWHFHHEEKPFFYNHGLSLKLLVGFSFFVFLISAAVVMAVLYAVVKL
jgi:hypothetical protein